MYEADEAGVNALKVVLPLMSRHAAGYHPISYTVWYEYARNSDEALKRDIDVELKRRDRLTIPLTYALYIRYLVEPVQRAVLSARSGVLDLAGVVTHTARRVERDAKAYGARLNAFKRELGTAATIDDMRAHVSAILTETDRFSGGVDKLCTKLQDSQSKVKELTDELARLREDMQIDTLSGLLNRRGFERELERLAPAREDPDNALAVIMLDIDQFKAINDTYGHPLGDVVISTIGRVIRECVTAGCVAARYGGEEFVVLMPRTSASEAGDVAEAIRKRVEEGKIRRRQSDSPIAGVTISAGVAAWRVPDDLMSLIDRADRALYTSKRAGRNCVTLDGKLPASSSG